MEELTLRSREESGEKKEEERKGGGGRGEEKDVVERGRWVRIEERRRKKRIFKYHQVILENTMSLLPSVLL